MKLNSSKHWNLVKALWGCIQRSCIKLSYLQPINIAFLYQCNSLSFNCNNLVPIIYHMIRADLIAFDNDKSSSKYVPYCEIYQLQQPLLHPSWGLQLQLFSLLVPHTCLVFAHLSEDLKHRKTNLKESIKSKCEHHVMAKCRVRDMIRVVCFIYDEGLGLDG